MARWYPLEPVDESFFTSAPEIHRYVLDVAVPPERVFESLQSDQSLAAWGAAVRSVSWLTPRPFGIGTRREVVLALGLVTVREQFFRWDEGGRYSFFCTEASAPLFTRFAEDYLVEPRPGGARLTWVVAIEPAPRLRSLAPVTRRLNHVAFGQAIRSGKKHFAKNP